jgi:hypothetical protein
VTLLCLPISPRATPSIIGNEEQHIQPIRSKEKVKTDSDELESKERYGERIIEIRRRPLSTLAVA